MAKRAPSPGFTLIELSIVLTIVGLIIGGILVGSDLIEAAKIRRTISQTEKIITAAYTFKAKFNWMPGDMVPTAAQDNGLTQSACFTDATMSVMVAAPPATYLPDGCQPFWWPTCGNDKIDEGTFEAADFYTHLSMAQLVEGLYGQSLWASTNDQTKVYYEPALKRGVVYPADCGGVHCFILGASFLPPLAGSAQANPLIDQFTPYESFAIDVKLDDGKPNTGRVAALTTYQTISRDGNGIQQGPPQIYPTSQQCCTLVSGPPGNKDSFCTPASDYDVKDGNYRCMIQSKW